MCLWTHTHRTVATDRQREQQWDRSAVQGKLNRGLSWTPDEDAHTCMPAPRPTEGPEASTLRPPGPTSWGAHSRVETSLDYWRRKCSHRPRWGGEGFPWTQAPQPPSQPQPEHPSQPRPQPALHASSLSLCPVASHAPPRPLSLTFRFSN